MMNPIAASTRSAASSGSSEVATDSPAEDIAPKKIRAKVCSIGLVELPRPGAEHGADDVEDGGERRPLLLLAVPLVAEHRGALLDHDPAVARLLDHCEERPEPRPRLLPRVPPALERLVDGLGGIGLDPFEDGLEQRLLAAEVVVQRALGHPGARDDRVERGVGVAVLGEQVLGDVDQRALGGGGVLLAPAGPWDGGHLGHQARHRFGHSARLRDRPAVWRALCRCFGGVASITDGAVAYRWYGPVL